MAACGVRLRPHLPLGGQAALHAGDQLPQLGFGVGVFLQQQEQPPTPYGQQLGPDLVRAGRLGAADEDGVLVELRADRLPAGLAAPPEEPYDPAAGPLPQVGGHGSDQGAGPRSGERRQ